MTEKEELEWIKTIQNCETREELSEVILQMADANGEIQGRTRKFKAATMAMNIRSPLLKNNLNLATRKYGIRQQCAYILYYEGS